jgi:hypothetical protein
MIHRLFNEVNIENGVFPGNVNVDNSPVRLKQITYHSDITLYKEPLVMDYACTMGVAVKSTFYSINENLVLWARSEIIGSARINQPE